VSLVAARQARPGALDAVIRFRFLADDRLTRLAAEGNEYAFAAIYERHHQGIYRYCRSIVRNDEDAKDALQNTMVMALRALPGETRKLALKPWLYRIARNEAISLLRRRANDAFIEDIAEVAGTAAADGGTRERLRTLISDLKDLPERQRSALVLRELNGCTYQEIGVALETSTQAAKQSVYEAREALHQLADGREMECEDARRSISADDRRILRGRKLRAHLRSCRDCRTFERALPARKADLAALAPPLPAGVGAAMLQGVLGSAGSGGVGGGLLSLLTVGAGNSVAGSAVIKAGAAAATVALGVGSPDIAERAGAEEADGTSSGRHVAWVAQSPGGCPAVSHAPSDSREKPKAAQVDEQPVAEPEGEKPVAEPQGEEQPVAQPVGEKPVAEPQGEEQPVAEPEGEKPVGEPQGDEQPETEPDAEEKPEAAPPAPPEPAIVVPEPVPAPAAEMEPSPAPAPPTVEERPPAAETPVPATDPAPEPG
jgi:RNA polymerase sigma factor (sigma-70 family)